MTYEAQALSLIITAVMIANERDEKHYSRVLRSDEKTRYARSLVTNYLADCDESANENEMLAVTRALLLKASSAIIVSI